MKSHYNLYYLFLDDKKSHSLPQEKKQTILNHLLEMLKKHKPP